MSIPASTGRRETLTPALPYIVAGISLIVGLLLIQPYGVGVFHDDGAYAILARSIAEGRGFHFLHLPGEPVAIHYPPVYPLLLSVLWRVSPAFPANVTLLLAINALFLGVTAWGCYRIAQRLLGWSPLGAAAAALIATLAYPLLQLTVILISEPMFVAALVLLVPIAESMVSAERLPRWKFFLFGLACGGLALIRTHGLSLPAAVVLLLLWRRRWPESLWCMAGVVIAILPWQLWQSAHGGDLPITLQGSYGSYVGWLVDGLRVDGFVSRTLSVNAHELWGTVGGRFAPTDGLWTMRITSLLAIALLVFGAWKVSRRAPVLVWFTIVYMAIVMAWPYTPWRFVFAIWPLFLLFLGEVVRVTIEDARSRRPRAIVLGIALLPIIIGFVVRESRAIRQRSWSVPAKVAAQRTVPSLQWIVRNTKESDVVASEVAEMVYLYTGRHAVPVMPFNAWEYGVPRTIALDAANLREVVNDLPVGYVVTISRPMADAAAVPGSPALVRMDTAWTHFAFRVVR